MKLETSSNTIESYGVEKSTKCKIANSKKAFEVLANMYTNSIKAIIRELSTNAYDSHIAAKTQKSFDVHLPTDFEPNFWIRDYGTGMSKEKVEELYSTYLESDKTDSDEFVGCLGIGSKSPFSYTRSFSVTSFYEGMQYAYVLNLSDDDFPEINLFDESLTTQLNGVKVEIVVKPRDFNKFYEEAEKVYKYFSIKPNFVGKKIIVKNNNIKLSDINSEWQIPDTYIADDFSAAIMGNVEYPIDEEFFRDTPDSEYDVRIVPERYKGLYENQGNIYFKLIKTGIVLNFNIGELSFTPSRETLKYNDKVINQIKSKIDKLVSFFMHKLNKDIEAARNYFQACKIYSEYKNGDFREIFNILFSKNDVLYKNQLIIPRKYIKPDSSIKWQAFELVQDNYYNNRMTKIKDKDITIHKDIVLLNRDIDNAPYIRIREYLLNNKDKTVYLFNLQPHKIEIQKLDGTVEEVTIDYKQELLELLGCDESDFINISTLTKPKRHSVYSPRIPYYVFKSGNYHDFKTYWNDVKFNMDDGGLYIKIDNYDSIPHPKRINHLVESFTNQKIIVPQIIGIKYYAYKKFIKDTQNAKNPWYPLNDWFTQSLQDFVKKNNIVQIIQTKHKYDKLKHCFDIDKIISSNKDVKDLQYRLKQLENSAHHNRDKVNFCLDIATKINYIISDIKLEDDKILRNEINEIYTRYDFLKYLNGTDSYLITKLIDLYDREQRIYG